MKKIFIIAVLLAACMFASANETETNASSKKENKTLVHPENYSHWSLAVGGGGNLFLGELNSTQDKLQYLKNNLNWGVQFQCEYMINPIWGVMVEYMFCAQNKDGRNYLNSLAPIYPSTVSEKDLQMHEFNLQVVFNLLNLVRRTRTHTEWNLFIGAGAGLINFEGCVNGEQKFNNSLSIPLTMSVEYCPISSLGIFLDAQYRYYFKDNINGVVGGINDMNLYGGLGLRYHILATKKPHVHVVDMNTYEPITSRNSKSDDATIEDLQSKIDFLTSQMNIANTNIANLEKANQDKLREADSINAARISNMANSMNAMRNQLDSFNYEGGGDIYMTTNNLYQYNTDASGIYFDYNSDVVKSVYYKDVLKIARRMLNDNKLKLRLTGYCDSRGTEEYNKELAQKRINAILYILVNRYRIDKERFVTNSIGKVEGATEVDELNRRVDIEYYY